MQSSVCVVIVVQSPTSGTSLARHLPVPQLLHLYANTLCQAVTLTSDRLIVKIRNTSSITGSKSV